MRKKRSVNDTETALVTRLKRQADGLGYSEYRRRLMEEKRLFDRSYGRYDDTNDRYRSDRYDIRYRSYDDRPYDRYRYRSRYNDGRARTHPCGRFVNK